MTRKLAMIAYGTKEQIGNYFNDNYSKIKKYAYIYHDKDETEPHWHIYIYFNNATTFERVKKQIQKYTKQNVMTEEARDEKGLIAYFTHENENDKYKYSSNEIVISNKFFELDNVWLNMYIDFVELKKPVKEMITMYGKDFAINIKNWRDLRAERREEEIQEKILKNNEKSIDKEKKE